MKYDSSLVASIGLIAFSALAGTAAAQQIVFEDDFEEGLDAWTLTGLFHPVDDTVGCGALVAPFPSRDTVLYCGLDGVCNFDEGGFLWTVSEVILNDPITMPATADDLWLTIWSFDDVECGSCAWDWRFVYVSANGGPWEFVGESDMIGNWYQPAFDLTPYLGQSIRFKFHFDAVDGAINQGLGWFIDDVRITADGCDNSTTYCDGFANSVGAGSDIGFTGSSSISAGDFTLTSAGNPASQFGTFYYGPAEVFIMSGDGMRCVGAGATGVFRLDPSSFSDPAGNFQRPVDFTTYPAGSVGGSAITAGSTWKFQLWYRDPTGPGGAFFNFSDAMSVTFCP